MKFSSYNGAIKSTLIAGLAAVIPAIITIYVVIVTIEFLENSMKAVILTFVDEHQYIPGIGLAVFIAILFLAGALLQMRPLKYLYSQIEGQIQHVPLAKSIYPG